MTRSLDLWNAATGRWLVLALTATVPPSFTPIGIAVLWVLVLRQEGKSGVGLAAGMSLAALTATVMLYAGL